MSRRSRKQLRLQTANLPQDDPAAGMTPPEKVDVKREELIQCPHMDRIVPERLCWRTEDSVRDFVARQRRRWTLYAVGGWLLAILANGGLVALAGWYLSETRTQAVNEAKQAAATAVKETDFVRMLGKHMDTAMSVAVEVKGERQ